MTATPLHIGIVARSAAPVDADQSRPGRPH
jgi:hypothetical protein